jgi:hypothetical protein
MGRNIYSISTRVWRSPAVTTANMLDRDTRGATAIEFAMIAPILFILTLGTIELGICFAADILLRNATYTAARVGRTGYVAENTTRDDMLRKLIADQSSVLMDASRLNISSKVYGGFGQIHQPEPFIDANNNGRRDNGESYTDINGNGQYDTDRGADGLGGSSQIVIYTVTYPWTFFTPLIGHLLSSTGTIDLTATAVIQNEPY